MPRPGVLARTCLLGLLLSLVFSAHLSAQVAVGMKMNKSNYILNEPVTATITIANHAGRELVLRSTATQPWLSFNLTSSGRTIPTARRVKYGPVVIAAGQTVSRVVEISASYSMGNLGNYTCTAMVNMPGSVRNGFSSNRAHFTVTNGRVAWVQRAGIPNAPGEIREYKLISFTGNRQMELYAQVLSANTGQNIRTIPLGKVLNFRKPVATLDGSNNMHTVYQIRPDRYRHVSISPKGVVLSSDEYKRGAVGNPRLTTFGDGVVRVSGGVLYDAEAEAIQKRKVRDASERPAGVYR